MTAEAKTEISHSENSLAAKAGLETGNRDVALDIFSEGQDVAEAIDPAAEKRLVRKIDMCVMPFICITYLVTYIDKATLGYAAVFDLQKDLNLHGTQYSWISKFPA